MVTTSDARAIGKLEGKIDMMLAEQQNAAQSRKQTYEKLEVIDKKVDASEAKIDSIDERLEKVEAEAAEISKWRERFKGMQILVIIVAGAAGTGLAALWKWLAVKIGL
jgi:2-phosphoglycerate kinase